MDWITSHDISGLEEHHMEYLLDFVVSHAVLMSWYRFLRKVSDVSRKESRLDLKKVLYLCGSCSTTHLFYVVSS